MKKSTELPTGGNSRYLFMGFLGWSLPCHTNTVTPAIAAVGKKDLKRIRMSSSNFNNSASVRGMMKERDKTPFPPPSVFLIPHLMYAKEKLAIVTLWSQALLDSRP